jgi:hypothetical protein
VYGAMWRNLPGGPAGKLASCTALLLVALALLFYVIFPWVEPRLPWNDVTVNSPSIDQQTVPSGSPVPSGAVASPTSLPAG